MDEGQSGSGQRKVKFRPRYKPKSGNKAQGYAGGSSQENCSGKGPQVEKPDSTDALDQKYKSLNPITIPWRKPNSEDPEILVETECGEEERNWKYDENSINSASDLRLLEESQKEQMFFFTLPANLPYIEQSATEGAWREECSLNEMPKGKMGKMLIYKSGAIKLKLGESLYDVSPGTPTVFAEDVAAINTADKHFCILGGPGKHAVVAPDVASLLGDVTD